MKLRSSPSSRQDGGVLLMTVCTVIVVGIILIAYVSLVSNHQQSVRRSEAWNDAMGVAEAGVEEAMAHLNQNYPGSLTSYGWFPSGTNVYLWRTLGDGIYIVSASTGPQPVVVAQGYVRLPWNNTWVSRTVRINTARTGLVNRAVVTKLALKLNGYTINTDSFDSSNTNYSTANGRYDPAKAQANGDLATNSELDGALDVGNSKVYGKVGTGGGTVATGPNGSVGDAAWHFSLSTGIEPGWSSDDINVPMPDVQAPFSGGAFFPGGGIFLGTNYNYILGSGNYQSATLGGKVLVVGNAVLYVTSRLQFTGQDYLLIAPGASLQLYVGAHDAELGGGGVINQTGISTNFTYYGLPSNKTLSIGGGSEFTGLIYAPSADVTVNGNATVYGAIMSKSLALKGGVNLHYDEALRLGPGPRRFQITSWDEI